MYNRKIIDLEKQIIQAINNSGLHIGTISLILDKIKYIVDDTLSKELEKELQEPNTKDNDFDSSLIEIEND